jgi:pentapeptide repeat protein
VIGFFQNEKFLKGEDCMKVIPPRIQEASCETFSLSKAVLDAVCHGRDIENSRFSQQKLEEIEAPAADWKGCIFENIVLRGCHFSSGSFQDCIFAHCDLSNVNLSDGSLQRVMFGNCKLTGLNLFESHLIDVTVCHSNGKYVNFSGGKLKNVWFDDCDLSGAVFDSCELKKAEFTDTRLIGADFLHTKLNGVDLTTCEIDGISLSGSYELKGAVVTPYQACELARFLGVNIKG